MGVVNVVDPTNGKAHAVDEETAVGLEKAGWTREGAARGTEAAVAGATENYFSGGGQQLLAGAEGLASGATLGLFDLLDNGDNARRRAEFNPGTRLAGELIGAVAPAVLSGGASEAGSAVESGGALAKLSALTPAGAVSRLGVRVGKAVGGVKGFMAGGALEGAIVGLGGAVTNAQLSDDPLTVESSLAGLGLGLILGAGGGMIAGGLAKGAEHATASLEAASAAQRLEALSERSPSLGRLADTTTDMIKTARGVQKSASELLNEANDAVIHSERLAKETLRPLAKADEVAQKEFQKANAVFSDATAGEAEIARRELNRVYGKIEQASASSGPEAAARLKPISEAADRVKETMGKGFTASERAEALAKYRAALEEPATQIGAKLPEPFAYRGNSVSGKMPVPPPGLPVGVPLAADAETMAAQKAAAKRAGNLIADYAEFQDALRRPPKTLSDLAGMTEARAQQYFGGLRKVLEHPEKEFSTMQVQLNQHLTEVAAEHGVALDAKNPVAVLESLRASSRAGESAGGVIGEAEKKATKRGHVGLADFLKNGLSSGYGTKAGTAAKKAGAGMVGAHVVRSMVRGAIGNLIAGPLGAAAMMADVVGLKGAVAGNTRRLLAKFGKEAAKGAMQFVPLSVRLSERLMESHGGELSGKKIDIRVAAAERAKEVTALAASGAHHDSAWAAMSPAMAHAPRYAAAVMKKTAAMVDYLAAVAPKDPGGTNVMGKSDWVPSTAEAYAFAATYEAMKHPMDALARLLHSKYPDPDAADALWNNFTSIMTQMQGELAYTVASGEHDYSYADRLSLSATFRIPLDGLLRPETIAAVQATYIPLDPSKLAPQQSGSNPGGRPPAVDSTQQTKVSRLQG